jgi:hypothetical protein
MEVDKKIKIIRQFFDKIVNSEVQRKGICCIY